jgi:hypothetical protein
MTTLTKIATREEVVAETRSWIKTPYHKAGRIKGAGVDCGTLLLCVFIWAGFISEEAIEIFNKICPVHQDWWCHAEDEKYTKLVIRHATRVLTGISYQTLDAKPGSIVVTHHSSSSPRFNHGGIVTRWPKLCHAVEPCVQEIDATKHHMWSHREVIVYDPWEKLTRGGE